MTFPVNPDSLSTAVSVNFEELDHLEQDADKTALLARGRLAEARRWFTHLGWDVLPEGIRGRRILRWGADQAYLASPGNPKRSVRRWCRKWDPQLSNVELGELVAGTRHSNKRWSSDQCAAVLGITVRDRESFRFRFLGACDDPNHEVRLELKREKNAARNRRHRAAHSTGASRGRPALELPPEDRLARSKAQDAERVTIRRRRNGAVPREEYLAGSKSRNEPWKALGMSKTKFYRLGYHRADETGAGRKPLKSLSSGETGPSRKNA
jgi:hypothetical protein